MDLNIHNVVKIEVKPRTDLSNFSTRDLVIHSQEYSYEAKDYITNRFTITTFFDDKDIAKLVYSKD